MDDHNFWQDLFDTYQSLSDWMKFAWLIVPPTFLLSLQALLIRYWLACKSAEKFVDGELVYSIKADAKDQLHIYRHGDRQLSKDPLVHLQHLLEHNNSEHLSSGKE
ncbi:MAG: hypothetical protein ABJM29_03045 [Rhizobiaceae bacterium]